MQLPEVVPGQGPEQRRHRHERRRGERQRVGVRLAADQPERGRDDQPEHHVIDHQQRARVGEEAVDRGQCEPAGGQIPDLPDRRLLHAEAGHRPDGDQAVAPRQRPVPLVVPRLVPRPARPELAVALERLRWWSRTVSTAVNARRSGTGRAVASAIASGRAGDRSLTSRFLSGERTRRRRVSPPRSGRRHANTPGPARQTARQPRHRLKYSRALHHDNGFAPDTRPRDWTSRRGFRRIHVLPTCRRPRSRFSLRRGTPK